MRKLPCAKRRQSYSHRGARPRARTSGRAADIPFGMGRHGNNQPAFHHLQQSSARGAAQGRGRALPGCRILSLVYEQRPADLRTGGAAMITRGSVWSKNMRRHLLLGSALVAGIVGLATAAASADDFNAAYAKAEAAEKQAAALKNQWTTAEAELKAAQAAAKSGNYDEAAKRAQQAEA